MNIKELKSEEVLFESPAKNKLGIPYLTMVDQEFTDGSHYTICRRALKDRITWMLVDFQRAVIGCLSSVKPYTDTKHTDVFDVFGESLDVPDENPLVGIRRGLKEECGFNWDPKNIYIAHVGDFMQCTSMDEVSKFYIVAVSDSLKADRNLEKQEGDHVTVWLNNEQDILEKGSSLVQTGYLHLISKYNFSFRGR